MSRSTYYRTCPDCGDNLDPGERCDCKDVDKNYIYRTNGNTIEKVCPDCGIPLAVLDECKCSMLVAPPLPSRSEQYIVSFDYTPGDVACLLVSTQEGGKTTIINGFYGSEAIMLANKLKRPDWLIGFDLANGPDYTSRNGKLV